MVQRVRWDRKAIRVTLEFQASWAHLGILGHQEQTEMQARQDYQDLKGPRAKKALLVPKAHLASQESQVKKANRAETESQVPLENRAKQENQDFQEQREPEVHRASRDIQVILAHLV